MKVLVACEFSGVVRDAFAAKGHDAWSCDLLPTESPGNHIQGDVLAILDHGWGLIIAHPPCTRLCNSGVRWLAERDLWDDMRDGAAFFNKFKGRGRVCIENPIPHKYARELIGGYTQIVQPWMFGDNQSKATCLWLDGLPPLVPSVTRKPDSLDQRVHRMPPGPDRQKERSRFFPGIAEAMANQWTL